MGILAYTQGKIAWPILVLGPETVSAMPPGCVSTLAPLCGIPTAAFYFASAGHNETKINVFKKTPKTSQNDHNSFVTIHLAAIQSVDKFEKSQVPFLGRMAYHMVLFWRGSENVTFLLN